MNSSQQLINEKMKRQDNFISDREYIKAFWNFFQSLSISNAVIYFFTGEKSLSSIELKIINKKFSKFVLDQSNPKLFKSLSILTYKYLPVISKAVKLLEDDESESDETREINYPMYVLGVSDYEFDE